MIVSVPVIVSPSANVSLLMFSVADAFGALNDLNSGKRGIPHIFCELMWLAEEKYLIAYEFRFGFHTFLVCERFLCSL